MLKVISLFFAMPITKVIASSLVIFLFIKYTKPFLNQ